MELLPIFLRYWGGQQVIRSEKPKSNQTFSQKKKQVKIM